MLLQYASDLHLEFPANKAFIKKHTLQPVGDVLVLAGDIVPFSVMDKHGDFFSYVADNFETTYWLPGNHEHYHFDIAEKSGVLDEAIRSNVFLVNNTSVVYENAKLIFSTLWSKIVSVRLSAYFLLKKVFLALRQKDETSLYRKSEAKVCPGL